MNFYLNLFIIIADQIMLFIINVLVARHAGEKLFGDFSVATNTLLLLATFITFGIDSVIGYYIPKFYVREQYEKIVRLIISVKAFLKPIHFTFLIGGILVCLSIIVLALAIKKVSLFEISHPVFLFLWCIVIISLYTIFFEFFRSINYMRTAILLNLTQTSFYFILSLFTYLYVYPVFFHHHRHYFPHLMLLGFVLSYVLIMLISIAIERKTALPKLYRKKALDQNCPEWREKIYGYTVQNLNKYIFTTIPLLVIEWVSPREESVGLFSAVVSIISIAFIAISPIGILISPDISAAFAQSRETLKNTLSKYLLMTFGISLIIVILIAASAPYILTFYKFNFIKALPYTYFCLINIVVYSISMPLVKMIQYSKEGCKIGAQLTIAMMLVQITACLIFIPWLNLLGAVICYIGINLIYIIVMVIMAIKIYRRAPFGQEAI